MASGMDDSGRPGGLPKDRYPSAGADPALRSAASPGLARLRQETDALRQRADFLTDTAAYLEREQPATVAEALQLLRSQAKLLTDRANAFAQAEALVASDPAPVGAARRRRAASTRDPARKYTPRARTGCGAGAMARTILLEWGRPARAKELLEEILRRGVHVGGKNPAATLASTLLKYPGVRRVSRGLFGAVKDWQPGAGSATG